MSESAATSAENPCWTCRRRRRRCDRRLPACQQCVISQHECLGYSAERPLRWTDSIASRGKWMGKRAPGLCGSAPIERVLVDPALQDFSPSMRGYISYFETYCCQECVLYDLTSANPFKEFMRLMPSSGGLCHIIVSIAALHQAQRRASSLFLNSLTSQDTSSDGDCHESYSRTQMQQSTAYYDALFHKQKALQFLIAENQRVPLYNSDGVIATVLMFIWLHLIESGRKSWKYHLNGLRQIVQARRLLANPSVAVPSSACEYFDTSYAIFEIMGSTFLKYKQPYHPLFTTIPSLDILERCESQTWAGCPAALLNVLSLVNSASDPALRTSSLISEVCSRLAKFSPAQWALSTPYRCHTAPRYHVSHLYKAAIEIYAFQVFSTFPYPHATCHSLSSHSLDFIIMQFTAIDPKDIHFKGLIWPAFVIGAEARTETQRNVIMKVLGDLWALWRSQNLRNAARVLNEIWALRDGSGGSPRPWIEYLYEREEDWMFV